MLFMFGEAYIVSKYDQTSTDQLIMLHTMYPSKPK